MPVRKVQRFTEQDLQRISQAGMRGSLLAQAASGAKTGIPVEAAGSSAVAVAGRNDQAARNEVMLAWPPSILSPNTRAHWAAKNRAVKLYREDCAWLTKAAGLRVDWDGIVHVSITFYPPSRRHFDDDNLVASFKNGRDGMADALGINDKRFRIHPWLSDEVVRGGAVKVYLSARFEAVA